MSVNASIACLHYNNYHAKLFESVYRLDDYNDVVIWVDGKTINAHRFVLAAGSTEFHKMLQECNRLNKLPMLILTDMKFKYVSSIIQFLYTGKTEIPSNELDEFFRIANKLKIIGLYKNSESDEMSESLYSTGEPQPSNTRFSVTYEIPSDGADNRSYRSTYRQSVKRTQLVSSQFSYTSKYARLESSMNGNAVRSTMNASDFSRPSSTQSTRTPAKATEVVLSKSTPRMDPATENDKNTKPDKRNENKKSPDGSINSTNSSNNTKNEYRCETIGCGKVYETQQLLFRHKKYKCGQTPQFECEKCHKTFLLRMQLKNHRCEDAAVVGSGEHPTQS